MRKELSEAAVRDACSKSSTMAEAARLLDIPYRTLQERAKKYGCYNPNPRHNPHMIEGGHNKLSRQQLIDGDYKIRRSYQRERLYREGLLQEECSKCGIGNEWCGEHIVLQLDHIDGDNSNNKLENLRILCPNCHSQTATWGNNKRH